MREREREGENIIFFFSGTNHFNQCDMPFVTPRVLSRIGLKESTLGSEKAHQINMDICTAFLRRHLLNGKFLEEIINFYLTGVIFVVVVVFRPSISGSHSQSGWH